jgi:hypothetical protein
LALFWQKGKDMPKCKKCGQDHRLAFACAGAKGGRKGKGKKASTEKHKAAIKANKERWKNHRKTLNEKH